MINARPVTQHNVFRVILAIFWTNKDVSSAHKFMVLAVLNATHPHALFAKIVIIWTNNYV